GGGGNEGGAADAAQDEGRQHAALRVDDEVETAAREWVAQQLRCFGADAGILDDLVDGLAHERCQCARIDRLALAGEPGDGRRRACKKGSFITPSPSSSSPE